MGGTRGGHETCVEPDGTVRYTPHRVQIVTDEEDGRTAVAQLRDPLVAACAKLLVANREHLVDQQDAPGPRARQRRTRARAYIPVLKCFTGVCARSATPANARMPLICARRVRRGRPRIDPVQQDVLRGGELGMEAGADLDQGRDPSDDLDAARIGVRDPRDELQQCALARPVGADDTECLAGRDFEVQRVDGGKGASRAASPAEQPRDAVAQCAVCGAAHGVALGDALESYAHAGHHTTSAK